MVEHDLAKVRVASSSLVFRSKQIKCVVTAGMSSPTTLLGGYRIVAIMLSFQVRDDGSIPFTRSSGPVSIRPKEK